jgi:beta-glucosidase
MDNRTYRYFQGTPLYGFGYGLSYTTFKYDDLKLPAKIAKGKNISVSVRIINTGKMAGEEVAQLYVINQNKSIKAPLKTLKGFERISLKAGESKTVTFTLSPEDLSHVTTEGIYQEYIGELKIAVGGHQPDEPNTSTSSILTKNLLIQ